MLHQRFLGTQAFKGNLKALWHLSQDMLTHRLSTRQRQTFVESWFVPKQSRKSRKGPHFLNLLRIIGIFQIENKKSPIWFEFHQLINLMIFCI
jgi:type IV secretory pathway VirD2 relaxase